MPNALFICRSSIILFAWLQSHQKKFQNKCTWLALKLIQNPASDDSSMHSNICMIGGANSRATKGNCNWITASVWNRLSSAVIPQIFQQRLLLIAQYTLPVNRSITDITWRRTDEIGKCIVWMVAGAWSSLFVLRICQPYWHQSKVIFFCVRFQCKFFMYDETMRLKTTLLDCSYLIHFFSISIALCICCSSDVGWKFRQKIALHHSLSEKQCSLVMLQYFRWNSIETPQCLDELLYEDRNVMTSSTLEQWTHVNILAKLNFISIFFQLLVTVWLLHHPNPFDVHSQNICSVIVSSKKKNPSVLLTLLNYNIHMRRRHV